MPDRDKRDTDTGTASSSEKDKTIEDLKKDDVRQSKTLWYPMQNIGNRPDLEGKSDEQNPTCDLEHYGAFHFEIYYFPEKIIDESGEEKYNTGDPALNPQLIKGFDPETTRQALEPILDSTDNPGENIVKDIGISLAQLGQFIGVTAFFTVAESLKMGKQSLKNMMESQKITEQGNNRVSSAPMLAYKGRVRDKFDIYLPLRNYNINRSSGIAENKDVISDIGTRLTKNVYNNVMGQGFSGYLSGFAMNIGDGLKTQEQKLGATFRDFVAPRVNSPSLETFELSWDLIPRSKEEMKQITDIIRCFQYLSIPNYNKEDLFYVLPPVMYMEAITKDFTKKGAPTVNLRPKKQYYLTNIAMTFSSNDSGEVLLTPDGLPMFINLKLNLIKADLASAEELYENPFM